jgi:hypothetical protein
MNSRFPSFPALFFIQRNKALRGSLLLERSGGKRAQELYKAEWMKNRSLSFPALLLHPMQSRSFL